MENDLLNFMKNSDSGILYARALRVDRLILFWFSVCGFVQRLKLQHEKRDHFEGLLSKHASVSRLVQQYVLVCQFVFLFVLNANLTRFSASGCVVEATITTLF